MCPIRHLKPAGLAPPRTGRHITRAGTLHRQPLCWHSVSSNKGAKPYQRLPSAASKPPGIPGSCPRFRDRVHDSGMLSTIPRNPEKWTSSRRNQWTPSIGMGGQHRLEWVVKMARNTQLGNVVIHLVDGSVEGT